jgi:DNA-binding transcriptional LysR family regulator
MDLSCHIGGGPLLSTTAQRPSALWLRKTVLGPELGQFARAYPDVVLDITTDDSQIDLVAAGFDAGIQFGEYIAQDMVAVRVSPDHRPAIIGALEYFKTDPKPASPNDLLHPIASTSATAPKAYTGRSSTRGTSP